MEPDYWKHIEHFESQSFREFMLLYGRDVWSYAYLLTRNPDYADDISQDVFVQVYRNIGSFRGESSIRTWLFSITRNRAANHRRSAFLRKVTLVGFATRTDTSPSAEHDALSHSFTNDVWELVMRLPVKLREVLVLSAKYELSSPEIANLLGLSEGTVKSRLSRARQKASRMWKEGHEHEGAAT